MFREVEIEMIEDIEFECFRRRGRDSGLYVSVWLAGP